MRQDRAVTIAADPRHSYLTALVGLVTEPDSDETGNGSPSSQVLLNRRAAASRLKFRLFPRPKG